MSATQFSTKRWTIATFAGWFTGIVLILVLSGMFETAGIHNMQFYIGIGLGTGVGMMQWLVGLRKHGVSTGWIWASIAGLGAPFLFFDLLRYTAHISLGDAYLPCSICLASLLTGVLQYPTLAQYSPKAMWWILMSFAGWSAAAITTLSINYTSRIAHNNLLLFFLNLTLILAGGPVLGSVTGFFMKGMLTRNSENN